MGERIHITYGPHAGEEGEISYTFESYKLAGDVVAWVAGWRELVLAGEFERSER